MKYYFFDWVIYNTEDHSSSLQGEKYYMIKNILKKKKVCKFWL